MLVLSRKLGEQIVVGDDIVIIVVGGAGDRVRLGISAPKGVPIHREEVLQRMRRESAVQNTAPAESRFLAGSA
jgi:carbon storage regulator